MNDTPKEPRPWDKCPKCGGRGRLRLTEAQIRELSDSGATLDTWPKDRGPCPTCEAHRAEMRELAAQTYEDAAEVVMAIYPARESAGWSPAWEERVGGIRCELLARAEAIRARGGGK